MNKAVIFGCGKIGKICFRNINKDYDIVAWIDNNSDVWGKETNGVRIISIGEFVTIADYKEIFVFVAIESVKSCNEVLVQLDNIGISKVYIWRNPFFYYSNKMLQYKPINNRKIEINQDKKSVLFVSSKAGIRDLKAAELVKNEGWSVYLAYFVESPKDYMHEYVSIYKDIFRISSINELQSLVANNDFNIIHCSSEPLFIVPVLQRCGKKIVLDVHDLDSMTRPEMTPESLMLENLAHTFADGVIYPNEALREEGVKRFHVKKETTCVVGNYVSRRMRPTEFKEKISFVDGEIHAVYEGLIASKPKYSKKYVEQIWLKIAEAGVHVHFYSSYNPEYCKYLERLHKMIHYEGNLSSTELSVEMTKYDIGLCFFNDNPMTHPYLKHSLGLKQYEYLNSGIPLAVGDMSATIDFVKKYDVGGYVDLNDEILYQMKEISKKGVPTDFLEKQGLYLEDNGRAIIELYCKLLGKIEAKK